MSKFVEKAVGRFRNDEDKAKAGLAKTFVAASKAWIDAYGEISLLQPKVKPQKKREAKESPRPLTLKEIVAKCADRYIGLGFHTYIRPDVSEEEAIEKYSKDFAVPKGARMPKECKNLFEAVVANADDPRIPISEKLRRAGISEWINTEKVTNQIHIPDKPYIVFTHDGTLYLPYTVNQAIARFKEDEVGEPLTETVDLYLNYPEFFKIRGRDSAGSRAGRGGVPDLNTFGGLPKVRAESPGNPDQSFGAGSRGKVIIVLGS